jgi:hypothetical protein
VPADAVAELQTYMLRWGQGRLSELRPSMEALVRQTPTDDGWATALALAYTEEGLAPQAARTLASLVATGFDAITLTVEYLPKLAAVAATIAFVGDTNAADELYEVLLAYADRDCTNLEFAYFGSASHWLGVLAATLGRVGEAEERFDAALERHGALRSPVWTAMTQHALASTLAGAGADADRVGGLVRSALSTATALGMRGLEKRLCEL